MRSRDYTRIMVWDSSDAFAITLRLLAAVLAGGMIGFERTYHGRPAGFRTHTLVCTASSLLMLLTVYQWKLLAGVPLDTLRVDPTRMAQGIMTGIGFLGAGVIMKDNLSIRGLTTAGSIWMTASIGILVGVGFYFAAALGTVLTIGILSLFRWIEIVTPSLHYGKIHIRFTRERLMPEQSVRRLLTQLNIDVAHPMFSLLNEGRVFEYEFTVRTRDNKNFTRAAEHLASLPDILEFRITPTGD